MRYSCTSLWHVESIDIDYCRSKESKFVFSNLAERVKGIVTFKDHKVFGFCLVVVVSIDAGSRIEAIRLCEETVVDAIKQTWLDPRVSLKNVQLRDMSQSDNVVEELRYHPAIVALRNFANSQQILDDIFGDPTLN